jgi:hypothetical protein
VHQREGLDDREAQSLEKFASNSTKTARVCWRETAAIMRENGAGPACGGARQIAPQFLSVILSEAKNPERQLQADDRMDSSLRC